MTSNPRPYEQMMRGAEYLAAIATDPGERAEHLMMAGKYHLRARQAGSSASLDTHH